MVSIVLYRSLETAIQIDLYARDLVFGAVNSVIKAGLMKDACDLYSVG